MESEEVARSNFLKKVSVLFSESKLDSPLSKLPGSVPALFVVSNSCSLFFHPKEKALA